VTAKVNFDYVKELQARATKNKKLADTSGQVLGDSRFAQMFEDQEFAIDRASENYKALRPTEGRVRVESEDEAEASDDQETRPKGKDLSRIFAGKDNEESDDAADGDDSDGDGTNFEKKLNRDQKKQARKKKDKIIKNYGALQQVPQGSKPIKKTKLKKGAISEQDVRRKLKEKRVVVPSRQLLRDAPKKKW